MLTKTRTWKPPIGVVTTSDSFLYKKLKSLQRLLTLLFILLLSLVLLLLQGCSYAKYQSADTTVTGIALFNRTALSGLHHQNGNFILDIDSYDKDNASGVSAIVEGTIKGMK